MKMECISVAGSGKMNEDAYATNQAEHLFAVVDGVSSLVPYENAAGQTGGAIAAQLVKQYVEEANGAQSLTELLADANLKLRECMKEEQIDLTKKDALWGAACALVRVSESHIEYAQTGDCMVFAVYADDTVRPLTYPQVSHLEQAAFAKWESGIQDGMRQRVELIEHCRDILVSNRYLANVAGGYGVINGEPACSEFLESGRINRIHLRALVLLTDGLFTPRPYGGPEPKWEDTVLPIIHKGLQRYTDELLLLENGDPECLHYVRFKKSDDKTGMVLYFS
ncbi:protein phosphatase 2C domain-containing protein [Brevibacillus choshinensis]|uniref:Protein phosphatase 2C domain-containing protein n=1 Tax=Brevibacillus choshinensis TaxID=54911 RepID=A0ABX7FQK4_BRECH|nr:protein phosphatase 2C domain-containing protein [Brevibacillus choshinensis]QRG68524.1 protein phosphatase 2C domain-containing protein [Brevibacillus choshinensis]